MGRKYVELHCHFDGSLDLATSFSLALKRNLINESVKYEEFVKMMQVADDNKSLEEYLKRFDLPISILQDEEALRASIRALIENLVDDNVIYCEIRYAPQQFTYKGLTQKEVVEILIDESNKVMEQYDIIVQHILCMMTIGEASVNHSENKETIEVAKQFIGKGVCAVDIAGAESISPLIGYKDLFDLAKEYDIPYTIHAGESGPASNVKTAMDMGAYRIGHGGHCSYDKDVLNEVIDKQIPLEMCISSNVHCCNQPSFEDHIIRELFDKGVVVTFNTDNRTMSNTTMTEEASKLQHYLNFSDEELDLMTKDAIDAAFIDDATKDILYNKIF